MSRLKNSFENYQGQKITNLGPKKAKDSKIKTKSNVRIEANLETKVVILYEWTTKHFFIQYPNPQNSPFGPKKPKNNLYILGQN